MLRLYRYIRENETRFFYYAKLVNTLLVALLLAFTLRDRTEISTKMMLAAFGLSLFSTVLWGIIFVRRNFDHKVAKIFAIIDLAVVFLLVFPVHYANALFMVLPVTILISSVFLISQKELNEVLFMSLAIFGVATLIYSFMNLIQNPLYIFASHLLLYSAVYVAASMSIPVISVYEKNQMKIRSDQGQLEKKFKQLQRELSISHQQVESLTKDIRKKDIEIKNIVNLSGQLKINNDFRKILDSFILTLIGQIGCAHAAIFTREKKEHNFYKVFVERGLRGMDPEQLRIYMESNLLETFRSIREPILVNQIPKDGLYNDEIEMLKLFHDDMVSPIFVRGQLAGILIVGKKISGTDFTNENINLASIVTNQASFLMEQSQASNDFQEVYFKTIRALTKALEAKYVFARGHNIRTANYASIVAKRMGIANGDVKDLTYGSLLHDIGKIAIKDEYLLNPNHFSDSEAGLKNKILEHTVKGASILKSAGFDEPIVDLALHHHELFNGKGYPHRLGEEDISRPARILAVCNTYDAMTSDRPHRKAHPESTAKEYLRAHAAKLFDPDVVKAFLSEIELNREMYKYH